MAKKRYNAEQIIQKLREAEVELAKGRTVGQVCRKIGATRNLAIAGFLPRFSGNRFAFWASESQEFRAGVLHLHDTETNETRNLGVHGSTNGTLATPMAAVFQISEDWLAAWTHDDEGLFLYIHNLKTAHSAVIEPPGPCDSYATLGLELWENWLAFQKCADGDVGVADLRALEFLPRFLRGDCDGDGTACSGVNDALTLLSWLFRGDTRPSCVAACDANGDGEVELTDAVYGLDYCFTGTAPPPAPFPGCGVGTAADGALGCDAPGCK